MLTQTAPTTITSDRALAIANADALVAYHRVHHFRVTIVLADDGWHVDYYHANPGVAGGGPHYIINADTGEIVWKEYHQ